MATAAENLQTAYDNLASAYATATANPKPNYSINGQSISWADYLTSLANQMKTLREALAFAEGPVEQISQGY